MHRRIHHEAPWHAVTLHCEPGTEDSLSNAVFASGFSGLEERERSGRTVFTAYFRHPHPADGEPSPPDRLKDSLGHLRTADGTPAAVIVSMDEVPDTDWETVWRQGLDAMEIGSRFMVRPSWVGREDIPGRRTIIIDPRMAFGTGGHETTRLCIEALERVGCAGKSVLDAGCGSGIVAIAAVHLGADRVHGFDHDPDSVGNARENIALNGCADAVTLETADLATVEPGRFDIVVANMLSGILTRNMQRFPGFLRTDGTVIFSGVLADEEEAFTAACRGHGLLPLEVTRENEWIAVTAGSRGHRPCQRRMGDTNTGL